MTDLRATLLALADRWETEAQHHANRVAAMMVDGDVPDGAAVPVALSVELSRGARELRAALDGVPDTPPKVCPACGSATCRIDPMCGVGECAHGPRGDGSNDPCPADTQPTEGPDATGPTQAHSADTPTQPHSSGEKSLGMVAPCGRVDEHDPHGAKDLRLCHGKLTWEEGTRPPCGHDGLCMIRWQHGTFGGVCVALPPDWVDLPRAATQPTEEPDSRCAQCRGTRPPPINELPVTSVYLCPRHQAEEDALLDRIGPFLRPAPAGKPTFTFDPLPAGDAVQPATDLDTHFVGDDCAGGHRPATEGGRDED